METQKQAKIYNAKVKSVPMEAPCSPPTLVSAKESGSWLHCPQKESAVAIFWLLNCLRGTLEFLVQNPVRLSLGFLIPVML